MEVSSQLHAPTALLPRKELGGPQRRSEHGAEETNSQPPEKRKSRWLFKDEMGTEMMMMMMMMMILHL
jgi:hypothetical protein